MKRIFTVIAALNLIISQVEYWQKDHSQATYHLLWAYIFVWIREQLKKPE